MTLQEKYVALMADLVDERIGATGRWAARLDHKIFELMVATGERYGKERTGSGDISGRRTGDGDTLYA